MAELLVCVGIVWILSRVHRWAKDEWRHSRENHIVRLTREHQDWSPGRIRRHARRRARGDWLAELRDGFPSLRQMLAEDRELARTVRLEAEAAGAMRMRDLRARARAAIADRDAARRDGARHVTGPEAVPVPAAPGAAPGTPPGAAPAPDGAAPGSTPDAAPADSTPAAPGSGDGSTREPAVPPRISPDADSVPDSDDDAVPNPPSDETTDETTEKEGDELMTAVDIEGADTAYEGMQNAFQAFADRANEIEKTAADDLVAAAAIHGFDRDRQAMADIQDLADQAQALVAKANAAKAGLIDRHAAGQEYHETGSDADASAFRAA